MLTNVGAFFESVVKRDLTARHRAKMREDLQHPVCVIHRNLSGEGDLPFGKKRRVEEKGMGVNY